MFLWIPQSKYLSHLLLPSAGQVTTSICRTPCSFVPTQLILRIIAGGNVLRSLVLPYSAIFRSEASSQLLHGMREPFLTGVCVYASGSGPPFLLPQSASAYWGSSMFLLSLQPFAYPAPSSWKI